MKQLDKVQGTRRCKQLQKLSREHQESLLVAEKIAKIAELGSDAELRDGIDLLKIQ